MNNEHVKGLSFMFSSQQFSKFIEQHYPFCFNLISSSSYEENGESYLDKLEEFTHTGYYTLFLHYLVTSNVVLKSKFQRFLNDKCHILGIPPIDLNRLKETCTTYDRQTILVVSLLYYFI